MNETGNFAILGRSVPAGRGWDWILSGFALFKKQPGIWVLIFIVFAVICGLFSVVPLIGLLINTLLLQIFAGGLMLGCESLDLRNEFEVRYLFAGFRRSTTNLVLLGVLATVGCIVVLIPGFLIVGGGSFLGMLHGGLPGIATIGLSFVLATLIVLALSIPLYMALWFAPALIVFHNLEPVTALKASFTACLRNVVPFLVYGVVILVLSVIAAIPFGLGLLVLGPVIIASIYTAYRDIFFAA